MGKSRALTPRRVMVVAEAGVNHNGDVRLAMELVDAAARAGADAVKFQTWKPGELTGLFAHKVPYLERRVRSSESRYGMSARLALPYEAFRRIKRRADRAGIMFLSTPDGFESLDFLADRLRIPIIKVGSSEVTHLPFLEAVGRKRRPVLLSTGMSSLGEVEAAAHALRRGGADGLTLLHCTSEYPAPLEEINLLAMVTLRNAFQLPVGLSDHSPGREASVAAVALGASVVEKHFTLDKSLPGPDHAASLDPKELADLVRSVRNTELMLGDGIKRMTRSERRNVSGIRRSIVAARPLPAGTVLAARDLGCKRPGTGLTPDLLVAVVGMRTTKALRTDEPLRWEHLK